MSFVKCYDAVSMVLEEATKRFSPLWKVDEEKNKILIQYCGVIDALSDEFDGESFGVNIDEISMNIEITLECQEISIDSSKHLFYSLISKCVSFEVSSSTDELIYVKFVFPGIWDKV